MELTSKVFALGNSNAIRFPQLVMEALSLATGDSIVMEIVNNREVAIRKACSDEAYPSIKSLLAGYSGEYHPSEMAPFGMVGKELI